MCFLPQKIVETSVPHQAAADGVQYAVSTKIATNKDERTTDKHRDKNIKDKTVCTFLFNTSSLCTYICT